jgi:acetyltransferase-like isoleucine patch superfamily enzyme
VRSLALAILRASRWLFSRAVALELRLHGVHVGAGCTFYGVPRVKRARGSLIELGDGCAIRSGSTSNEFSRGLPTVLSTTTRAARLRIGPGARLSDCVIVCSTSVEIGARTYVGVEALVTDTDAHPACPTCRETRVAAPAQAVEIGSECFLGARCIVLKGARLADGTCVGAGSVLGRSAEPSHGTLVGNPAEQVRDSAFCSHHAAG